MTAGKDRQLLKPKGKKMMYKKIKAAKAVIKVNEGKQGEMLERKIERLDRVGEPIEGEAPLMYRERKDGVNPETDIRTDKWEYALDGMSKASEATRAARGEDIGKQAESGS